jgi:hypothetical protein
VNPSGLARLHPSLAKPVIALPLLAMALISLGSVAFFLAGFEKSYSGFSNQYVVDQARLAYKENRFEEGATYLERLALNHKLDEDESILLNDIYFARSAQRAEHLNYAGAMADLNKIPPQYAKYVLVTSKKSELLELIKVRQQQQAQALAQMKAAAKLDRSKSRLASKSAATPTQRLDNEVAPSAISSLDSARLSASRSESTPRSIAFQSESTASPPSKIAASPPSKIAVSPSKIVASGGIESTLPRADGSGVRSDLQAPRSEAPAARAVSSPSRTDAQPPKCSGKTKSSKITENDQVRYNELLAGYFSQEHKQSGALEPPSLKEWIDSGRPKF